MYIDYVYTAGRFSVIGRLQSEYKGENGDFQPLYAKISRER